MTPGANSKPEARPPVWQFVVVCVVLSAFPLMMLVYPEPFLASHHSTRWPSTVSEGRWWGGIGLAVLSQLLWFVVWPFFGEPKDAGDQPTENRLPPPD